MKIWSEKEKRFLHFPYKPVGFKLSVKVRFTAVVVIMMAFIEHALFLWNSASNWSSVIQRCNLTLESPLTHFLEHQFPFLFGRIPISLPLGIFVEITNMSLTFGWNYMELFVMMVSVALMTRFEQINQRMKEVKGKVSEKLVM
jgi:gustatory receptor